MANVQSVQDRTSSVILSPFRAVVSKTAQRSYLNIILFATTSSILFLVSIVSYWIFYYNYVPQISLERPIYLQYGDGYPYGTALLGPELVHSQRYDVTVVLSIPSTPSNRAVGNFMIDLKLLQNLDHSPGYASNASRNYAVRSRRPASLTYASPMVDITRRFSMLPLYVLGLKRETENLKVRILERIEFPRSGKSVPEALRLEIQSETYMHIYKASIRFDARFSGLRWVMYNWRILSFLIFGSAFWLCSMSIAAWVWVILSSWSAGRGKTTIKDEDTDSEGDDRFLTGRPSMLKRRASSSVPRIKREEENTEPVDYGNTEDGEETIDNDSEGSISE